VVETTPKKTRFAGEMPRQAQRGFIDEAPVAHLLMHAADHDLGPVHKGCWK
jgi:hypothetical protein